MGGVIGTKIENSFWHLIGINAILNAFYTSAPFMTHITETTNAFTTKLVWQDILTHGDSQAATGLT